MRSIPVRSVNSAKVSNLSDYRIAFENREQVENGLADQNALIAVRGKRLRALEVLANLHEFAMYKEEREYPAKSATTKLSARNKFGTCSIREVYHSVVSQLGAEHQLILALLWRFFYSHIAFFFLTSSVVHFTPSTAHCLGITRHRNLTRGARGRQGFQLSTRGCEN
jgi:deoxyribodipyrimidine photolyase